MKAGTNYGVKGKAIAVFGTEELDRMFSELEKTFNSRKDAKKVLIKSFKYGAIPLVKQAKENVRDSGKKGWKTAHRHISKAKGVHIMERIHQSGELRRSIGMVQGKGRQPVLYIGPRGGTRATKRFDAWYAHFVEYGTAGYTIKKDKVIPTPTGVVTLKAGTRIPGQPAQRFMYRAWLTTRAQVKRRILSYLDEFARQIMRKHKYQYRAAA